MNQETHQKVTSAHLKRNAYLYIRQSTPRQVIDNCESTKRQYAVWSGKPKPDGINFFKVNENLNGWPRTSTEAGRRG